MLIFDRGLAFGSCAGEALTVPAIALAAGLALAGLALLLAPRIPALRQRVVPWLFAGIGAAIAAIALAAVYGGITARVEVDGPTLAVTSCTGPTRTVERFALASLGSRFHARPSSRRGPPTPLVEFFAGDREVASIWLEHDGVDLERLAQVAPNAVAEYRSWRRTR